ncbi:restriction endonuclease subunit S [Clostridium perfringens]|uniref:restriction endonuclease subunit S n=1 Tax=Clostridium perfringens TaxID=1502 RepID=UPI002AC3F010|nr:restriction endonuclease subunit S [Clostridium perfringens]MDK0916868.1 restriction endonuclease subunit S [Clostridium perfringens]MDZ5017891.1 restriction endonuclease subunit S [Clostridium perfringens]
MNNYKLEELCEFIRNGASIKQFENAKGYPITRIETIADSYINLERVGYADIIDLSKYEDYLLNIGDILMSHINSEKHLGKTAIFENEDKKLIHGMNLLCIRPDKKLVSPKYLNYYFKSLAFKKQLPKITKKSVNQASFSVSDLKKLKCKIHSIESQKKIVKILDKSQELIDKRKKQIEKLDLLVKSKFIEMFGDPITNSKEWNTFELREGIKEIKYGTSKPPIFSEEGIPFVRATNIKFGRIIENDMKYISEYEAEKIEKCKLSLGDTIIVRSGANTGDNAFVSEEYVGSYGGYDIIVKLNEKINYIFLNALLNSIYRETIIQPLTRRAGQPHLNSEQIQSLVIYNPPIELQNQFADFVKQVDKLKFELEKSLKELEDNFNSLMQKAFKGELFN